MSNSINRQNAEIFPKTGVIAATTPRVLVVVVVIPLLLFSPGGSRIINCRVQFRINFQLSPSHARSFSLSPPHTATFESSKIYQRPLRRKIRERFLLFFFFFSSRYNKFLYTSLAKIAYL